MIDHYSVGIVGAGPLGLELAIALKKNNISYIQLDQGQVAQSIYNFPPQTRFFSSSERIGIAGIPIQIVDQQKCSREEYLAYIRSLVMYFKLKVNTYEKVNKVVALPEGFQLTTCVAGCEKCYHVHFLVLATGGTAYPHLLNVPGENLPHVSVKLEDPHKYFQKKVVVIGGKNSSAESSLRCFHVGAHVSMVIQADQLNIQHIKYWLLPELQGRIERGEITAFFSSNVQKILTDRIIIKQKDQLIEVPADFVIKTIGFEADMTLFSQLGITYSITEEKIAHDYSMQTNVPNTYVLGTAVAGTQKKYRIFIENTHEHVNKILKDLCSKLSITSNEEVLNVTLSTTRNSKGELEE